tara:strand:- start:197 stop:652 length:456 start_codon:yes stop_codon:yes gene_type:complete
MLKNIFIVSLFFLLLNTANAKQLKITSDKLEIMRMENISIFTGKVYALEDNLEIWSEKLIVTSSKDEKEVKEINAHGSVKILRGELSINGNNAKYDLNSSKLVVFGEVKVLQNQNIILCDKIVVDLENSSSIMSSDSTSRVEALINSEIKN